MQLESGVKVILNLNFIFNFVSVVVRNQSV